jgi:hypothetical protein
MCRRRADVFGEAPGQGMHMTQTPNSPDNPAQPTTVQPTAAGATPAAGQAGSPSAANYGGQPPVASAPPPEGWQAGYEKMKQRSTPADLDHCAGSDNGAGGDARSRDGCVGSQQLRWTRRRSRRTPLANGR